jgi:hypothetical protein
VENPELLPVLLLILKLSSIIMGDNDIEYIEVPSSPFPSSSSTVDPNSDSDSEQRSSSTRKVKRRRLGMNFTVEYSIPADWHDYRISHRERIILTLLSMSGGAPTCGPRILSSVLRLCEFHAGLYREASSYTD